MYKHFSIFKNIWAFGTYILHSLILFIGRGNPVTESIKINKRSWWCNYIRLHYIFLRISFSFYRYYAICIDFETFYPQAPQKPRWVHNMCEELAKLRPKRLPIPEQLVHEQFKKYYGYKRAIKFKVTC